MIMSGQMLLDWLGRKHNSPQALKAAALIEKAADTVMRERKFLTGDLGGTAEDLGNGRCDRAGHGVGSKA